MAARDCECIPESNVLFGPGRGPSTNSAKFTVADKPRVLRLFDSSGDACVTLYTCTTVCGELFSAPAIQNGCQIELNSCSTEVMLYVPGNYYAVVEGADPEDIVLEHNQIDTQVSFSQNGAANMSCNKIEYSCDPLTGNVVLSGGPGGPCVIQPGGGTEVSFDVNGNGTTTLHVGGSSVVLDAEGVDDLEYDPNTGKLWITLNDGTEHEVTLPLTGYATSTVPGMVRLAVEADYPQHTNDNDATTPAYVRAAVLAAIPTVVQTGAINVTPTAVGEHIQYTVGVDTATATAPGVISLATGAEYPETGDTQAVTPAYLAAALAALPGDKFLAGLQSYNATTNTMTLLMNDGSTVPVDMTGLLNDALATIPDDPATPLASISALTSASRGLSLGEVNIPTNRALTVAEMTAANSGGVSVPLVDMQSVFTNKAAEPTAPGVMNSNGTLGNYMRVMGTFVTSVAANTALVETTNGGVAITGSVTNGQVINIPDGPYTGYHMVVGNAPAVSLGQYGEYVMRSAAGFAGVSRRTTHKFAYIPDTNNNDILVRAHEFVEMVWTGTLWRIITHTPYMFSGAGWMETLAGEVDMDFPFSNTDPIPAGQNLTYDVDIPVKLAGGQYLFSAHDRNVTLPLALGFALNSALDSSDVTFLHTATTGITDKARFTCFNNTGSNHTGMGTVYYHGNGVLDYADLGGIASY